MAKLCTIVPISLTFCLYLRSCLCFSSTLLLAFGVHCTVLIVQRIRHTYCAWLLHFIIALVLLQNSFLPHFSRRLFFPKFANCACLSHCVYLLFVYLYIHCIWYFTPVWITIILLRSPTWLLPFSSFFYSISWFLLLYLLNQIAYSFFGLFSCCATISLLLISNHWKFSYSQPKTE